MTKQSTRSASLTTTDGYTSRESRQKSLLERILAAAESDKKARGWFANLSPEQQSVVAEAKRVWRETRRQTGVSGAKLARAIISQLPDCELPRAKEISAWLHREQ